MRKTIQEKLAARIRKLRSERNLSQEDLCEKSGVYAVQISYIENAQRDPTLTTIERLAAGFGMTVGELMKDL